MKKNSISILMLLAVSVVLFNGCKKDKDDPVPVVNGKLTIEMDHLAGMQKFHFDSVYTTANGDFFTADLFKYYISNIRLIRTDNSEYFIPESYFLVNHDNPSSMALQLSNLASGTFKGIKFMIGVDSLRNVSGAQTGALSPDNAMFWDWNTGYIFFKLEGTSPSIPTPGQNFTYHIGGFSGQNVNYKDVNLDFDGDIILVANDKNPELHLVVNVLEVFESPSIIDLATFSDNVTITGPDATLIANNYADMIRYDHIHND